MALGDYDSYCANMTKARDRELLGKGLHIGPVNSTDGAANTLKSAVAWFAKVYNHRLDTVWPRFIESNSVSPKFKGVQLRLFWLVVFWADFVSAPVFAQDVIGVTLPTVVAESV